MAGQARSPLFHYPPPSTPGGSTINVTMYPTLVSRKKSGTSSVAFSFPSNLTEGALGCSHRHAFSMSTSLPGIGAHA